MRERAYDVWFMPQRIGPKLARGFELPQAPDAEPFQCEVAR